MKTMKEMIAVMQAYADGERIETKPKDGYWYQTYQPVWDWSTTDYRIAVTQDSIDWTHVHKDFKWMARDKDGKAFLFSIKPETTPYFDWTVSSHEHNMESANIFESYKRGTCDWKDSIVERPHV